MDASVTHHSFWCIGKIVLLVLGLALGGFQSIQAQTDDWGDAPDSYGTSAANNGPHHPADPLLVLGSRVDAEADGVPATMGNPAANDDTTGVVLAIGGDEDGLDVLPVLSAVQAHSFIFEFYVCNFSTTDSTAYTACWIDFNRNGVFEPTERASTSTTYFGITLDSLNFTTPNDIQPGLTYIRCRTSWIPGDVDSPIGPGSTGEVEDYEFTIGALPVELASFTADPTGNRGITLQWQTLNEENNVGFDVEMNWNGGGFKPIHFVEGAGTTEIARSYSHTLHDLSPGLYRFRLKQIDLDGSFTYSPSVEVEIDMPRDFLLEPAYPNPFNPTTRIRFTATRREPVRLSLFDTRGQWLRTLYANRPQAGITQEVTIDASDLPSGTYLVRLDAPGYTTSQSITLLK